MEEEKKIVKHSANTKSIPKQVIDNILKLHTDHGEKGSNIECNKLAFEYIMDHTKENTKKDSGLAFQFGGYSFAHNEELDKLEVITFRINDELHYEILPV